MLTHFLRTAARALWRNWRITAINVLGLAVSLTVCFVVLLFLRQHWQLDRFHSAPERIHRVVTMQEDAGGLYATAPRPLAPALRRSATGVEAATRLAKSETFAVREETSVNLTALYADASFLTVFDGFRLQAGDRGALARPHTALLTPGAMERLFGTDARPADAVGTAFDLRGEKTITVAGVLAATEGPTHVDGDLFLSYATLNAGEAPSAPGETGPDETGPDETGAGAQAWTDVSSRWTYVRLTAGASPEALQETVTRLYRSHVPPDEATRTTFGVESLSDLRFGETHWNEISYRLQMPFYMYAVLAALAVVVLLAAGFNYVNLTTAHSLSRAQEIGVRKTLGARQDQLVGQFIGEAVLTATIAGTLACMLLSVAVPAFNDFYILTLLEMPPVRFQPLADPGALGLIAAVCVGVGVLAGSYPAFVLAGYDPIGSLHAQHSAPKLFGSLSVRSVLIGVQFAFTLLLVVTAATMYRQTTELATASHTLRTDRVIAVDLQDVDYDTFRRAARRLPEVEQVTAINHLPLGPSNYSRSDLRTSAESAPVRVVEYAVDTTFVTDMGLTMRAMQSSWQAPLAGGEGLILNETAVRALGLAPPDALREAVGQTVVRGDPDERARRLTVVGVVKDFAYAGIGEVYTGESSTVGPMMLTGRSAAYEHALVRSGSPDLAATFDRLKALWTSDLGTERPFAARFYSDVLRMRYGPLQDTATFTAIITGLALLIALLGLFSIAAYTVQSRTKEIGIRKALGATAGGLVLQLSRRFVQLMAGAVVVALPLAWVLNHWWLQFLPDPVGVGTGAVALSVLALLAAALLTVGSQTLHAAHLNPATTLRDE